MLLENAKVPGPNLNSFFSNSFLLLFFGDPIKSHKMLLRRKIGIKTVKFRCFNGPKPLIPVSPESVPLNEGKIEG